MGCTLGHLHLGVQLGIQLFRQHLQFPIAPHLAEFLLRFQQPGRGPAGEVVTALPAFHVAGHVPHRRKTRLDQVRARQAASQLGNCVNLEARMESVADWTLTTGLRHAAFFTIHECVTVRF